MPSLETEKPIKKIFDAVELMRRLRLDVHEEIGRLGRDELKEYLRVRVNMPRAVAGRNSRQPVGRWEE